MFEFIISSIAIIVAIGGFIYTIRNFDELSDSEHKSPNKELLKELSITVKLISEKTTLLINETNKELERFADKAAKESFQSREAIWNDNQTEIEKAALHIEDVVSKLNSKTKDCSHPDLLSTRAV